MIPTTATANIHETPSLAIGDIFRPYKAFPIVSCIPAELEKYRDLSPGAKLVWARLARYQGKDGEAYPATATLAREVGMCERQARTYLAELRAKDFIKITGKRRGADRGKTNVYGFLWHEAFSSDSRQDAAACRGADSRQDPSADSRQDAADKENQKKRESEEEEEENQKTPSSSSSGTYTTRVRDEDDDEKSFSFAKQTEHATEKACDVVDLVELDGNWQGCENEDPLLKEEPLPEWYLQAAAEKIRESNKSGKGPDLAFTAKIIEPWRGKGTPAVIDWLLSTAESGLGEKNRATGPYRYGIFLSDSQNSAEQWHENQPLSKTVSSAIAAEKRAAEECAAAERHRLLMETTVVLKEAIEILNRENPSWQTRLNDHGAAAQFKAYMQWKSPQVAPAKLLESAKAWRRCKKCKDGIVGSPLRTLAFCDCAIGELESAAKGPDYIQSEVDRVNATLKSRLTQALFDIELPFTADAVGHSDTVLVEGPETVTVRWAEMYRLYGDDADRVLLGLQYLGDYREARIEGAEPTNDWARKAMGQAEALPRNGHAANG